MYHINKIRQYLKQSEYLKWSLVLFNWGLDFVSLKYSRKICLSAQVKLYPGTLYLVDVAIYQSNYFSTVQLGYIYVSKKREANNSSWNTQNSILVFFSFIFLVFICTQSPFTVHQLVLGVDQIHHRRRDHDQNLHGRHLVHHCLLLLSVIHKIPIIIQKPLLTSYAITKWDVLKKVCALPWGMLTTILLFGQCSFFKLQISTVIPVYEIKLYNPFWIILTVSGLFVTYYKLKIMNDLGLR